MDVSHATQQPTLPLEFRPAPFPASTELFSVTSRPKPDVRHWDGLTDYLDYTTSTHPAMARYAGTSIDAAFAKARALTALQPGRGYEVGTHAAIAQASDGYWVIAVNGSNLEMQNAGISLPEDPPFAPVWRNADSPIDSRAWTKTNDALVGIAINGKVLDMRGIATAQFDGYKDPVVS